MSKLCEHNNCDVVIQGNWDDCELCTALGRIKELENELEQAQDDLKEKEEIIETLEATVERLEEELRMFAKRRNWVREGF